MADEVRLDLTPEFKDRDKDRIDQTVALVARAFPSFGGNRKFDGTNPLDAAMEGKPASFALGVDIEEVVCFIFKHAPADPRTEEILDRMRVVADGMEGIAAVAREGHYWHTLFNELAFAVNTMVPAGIREKHPFIQRAIDSLHLLPDYIET